MVTTARKLWKKIHGILKLFISETTEPFENKCGWIVPCLILYNIESWLIPFIIIGW
jgi:hypothetical protein